MHCQLQCHADLLQNSGCMHTLMLSNLPVQCDSGDTIVNAGQHLRKSHPY